MKKLVTILLLILIFINVAFIILRVAATGSEDNLFNKNWREKFAEYPLARSLLALHYDGDAKADYLGNRFKKILIEVDSMNGLEISAPALVLLEEKIESITKKPVEIVESDNAIPYKEQITIQDLKETETLYRSHFFKKDQAVIYLLVVSLDEARNSTMGSTLQEDGLVLYKEEIKIFADGNPNTLSNYEESTVLHEFGHQIGLSHNNKSKCLMNESAEMARVARERSTDVVVDFCDYEKELINQTRTLFQ